MLIINFTIIFRKARKMKCIATTPGVHLLHVVGHTCPKYPSQPTPSVIILQNEVSIPSRHPNIK